VRGTITIALSRDYTHVRIFLHACGHINTQIEGTVPSLIKLLAVLSILVAASLITVSGAFATVQADRQANIGVTGDSQALLQLEPHNSTIFASEGGSEVVIDLGNSGATGLNTNATTAEDRLLNITNNGENGVAISIQAETTQGANVTFYVVNDSKNIDSVSDFSEVESDDDELNLPANLAYKRYNISDASNPASRIKLGSGEKVTVGIAINSTGLDTSTNNIFANGEVTITAIDENSTTGGDTRLEAEGTGT